MNFKEEELLSAVKAKLTTNGKNLSMSERTLGDMVKNHYSLASEEISIDDFVKKILPAYETVEGNLRHDRTSFIEQWKKEHPDPGKKTDPDNDDDPVKALIARIESLEKEKEEEKAAKSIIDIKAQISAKAVEKGVANKEWMDAYMQNLAVTAESDVEQMADSALRLFNFQNADASVVTPSSAGGKNVSGDDKDLFSDVAGMRKHDN